MNIILNPYPLATTLFVSLFTFAAGIIVGISIFFKFMIWRTKGKVFER